MSKSAKIRSEHQHRPRGARSHLVDEMQEYSQADLARLFHLPPSLIRSLAAAGYISKTAGEGKTAYGFQDLLIIRVASALKSAKIPSAKITAALGKIRGTLRPGEVLTTLALAASGTAPSALDGASEWHEPSGQHPRPLPAASKGPAASSLATTKTSAMVIAEQHYSRGHSLEDSDVTAARAAYLDALNAHGDHLEARINLGRLLHLNGELKAAEKVYRQAKSSSALLSFNLAILLEDLNREEEAIVAYREALAQDPYLHDAHFNLSRLHERAKQPQDALRHLLAYRRHIARYGG
jgi:hypothetical protein